MLMTLRKVPPSALAAARHLVSSAIGMPPPSQLLPTPELTVYRPLPAAIGSSTDVVDALGVSCHVSELPAQG